MRYTKLVRGYLDFDVDMENVRDFWKTAETAMAEHARYRPNIFQSGSLVILTKVVLC